jgi:predicted DNA-binding ribbon-helix-helix protein
MLENVVNFFWLFVEVAEQRNISSEELVGNDSI